jgi:hypothetical protein
MPRPMSSAMLAALQAPVMWPAFFVQAQFNNGGTLETVYMWTGLGPITWNGQTWLGLGSFLGITTAEEGTTVEAKGIALTLSAIDVSLLADALQNFQVGLPVIVYLGLFDGPPSSPPPSLIASPIPWWSGKMDQPTFDISGTGCTITISCETPLIEMNCSVERRYTLDDSQLSNPGDLAFMFVAGLQERTDYWGRIPSSSVNL